MADSHTPFAIFNRTGNVLVRGLLRSPLHGLASGRLALITVTGRRSGREFTFPVDYERKGETIEIGVMWPERKLWWRNLRGGAPVRLVLAGKELRGHGEAVGDEASGVTVRVKLD